MGSLQLLINEKDREIQEIQRIQDNAISNLSSD